MNRFLILIFALLGESFSFRSFSSKVSCHANPIFMSTINNNFSPRVQKIKDISLQKEVLRDITSSEFALQVEVKQKETSIDYEKLISKLDYDIRVLKNRQQAIKSEKNEALIQRIEYIKENLISASQGIQPNYTANSTAINEFDEKLLIDKQHITTTTSIPIESIDENITTKNNVNEIKKEIRQKFRVIVREDGSVDWDGALASGREVAKFGTELWERLNGKDETEDIPTISEFFGQVQAKEPETDETKKLKNIIEKTKDKIQIVINNRDTLKSKLRQYRKEGLTIINDDVSTLRQLDLRVKELEKRLKFYT
jgi:calcineurin-like phosphoesterase family protein